MRKEKVVIFSAPSGSGKTTLVKHCLSMFSSLQFSVSATTRSPRGEEKDGVDYHFRNLKEFRKMIENDEFIEYQEVYSEKFYGTLKTEIEKIWNAGKIVIFDVDVEGGVNLKKIFGEKAFSIFIAPPSLKELENRLICRCTDDSEEIKIRMEKAEKEMEFAKFFDKIVINDNLEKAKIEIEDLIKNFINS